MSNQNPAKKKIIIDHVDYARSNTVMLYLFVLVTGFSAKEKEGNGIKRNVLGQREGRNLFVEDALFLSDMCTFQLTLFNHYFDPIHPTRERRIGSCRALLKCSLKDSK